MARVVNKYFICVIILAGLLPVACGKDKLPPADPERDFVGQWTWEKRYQNDNDERITERLTIIFYDPSAAAVLGSMTGAGFITSGETYAYKWIYMYLVDGKEVEDLHYVEIGQFIADGTEVQFIPQDGETKVYQYVIPPSSEIDMILTDQDGTEWIFDRKEAAW